MGNWGQYRAWSALIILFILFIGVFFTSCEVTIESLTVETGTDTEDNADGITNNGDDSSSTDEEDDPSSSFEDDYDAASEEEDDEDDSEEEEETPEETEPDFMWLHVASTGDSIFLRWTDPAEIGGPVDSSVYVRRSASETCPTTASGTLVYNGTDQVFEDTTVTAEQTYCYKIWFDNDGYESPIIGGITEGTAYTDDGIAALLFHNQSTGAFYEWRLGVDGMYKSVGPVINETESSISPAAWSFEGMAELDDAVDEDLQENIYPKDIVWRNTTTGAPYYWLLNGDGTRQSSGPILVDGEELAVADSWTIIGFADLNPGETAGKDYYNDIIWQNDSGYIYYWLLEATENGIELLETCDGNGQNPGSSTNQCIGLMYPDAIPDSWTLVKTGNLLGGDADPEAEILLQSNSTGSIYIWELDEDGLYDEGVMVLDSPGTQWSIIDVIDFDFDFDDNADILLKNTSTDYYYISFLDSDGDIITTQMVYASAMPSTYSVVGIADVNGDAVSRDLIWQNSSTGGLYVWFLNADGTRNSYDVILESLSLDWDIKASPEY